MFRFRPALICAVASFLGVWTPLDAQDKPQAYPITREVDDVHDIAELTIQSNGLTLTARDVLAVPIRCDVGIIGAMLIGKG